MFLQDFQGTVLLNKILGIEIEEHPDHFSLKVGAGENWHQLVVRCLQKGIYGFENLALIPGTVGAAPIQNIGAYGVEVEKFIHQVEYYDLADGQFKVLTHDECQFSYRDSIFKSKLANKVIVTEVIFMLPKEWQAVVQYGELKQLEAPDAQMVFDQVVKIRSEKLPNPEQIGNAGSFFKNPEISVNNFTQIQLRFPEIPYYPIDETSVKIPAAWLIDQLGFKGAVVGNVQCHPRQALVLTNMGNASGDDLIVMAKNIKNAVQQEFGICLENEVRLIGQREQIQL